MGLALVLLMVGCNAQPEPRVGAPPVAAVDVRSLGYTYRDRIASLAAVTDTSGNLWLAWTDNVDRGDRAPTENLYCAVAHGAAGEPGFSPGVPRRVAVGSFGPPMFALSGGAVLLYCHDMFGPYVWTCTDSVAPAGEAPLRAVRLGPRLHDVWSGYWESMAIQRRAGRTVLVAMTQSADDSALVVACTLGDDSTIVSDRVIARVSRTASRPTPVALAASRDGFRWFARETVGPTTRRVHPESLVVRSVPGGPDVTELIPAQFEIVPAMRGARLRSGTLDAAGTPSGPGETIGYGAVRDSILFYDYDELVPYGPEASSILLLGDRVRTIQRRSGEWVPWRTLSDATVAPSRIETKADALELSDGRTLLCWVGAPPASTARDLQALMTGVSDFVGMGALEFALAGPRITDGPSPAEPRRLGGDELGAQQVSLCASRLGALAVFAGRSWPHGREHAGSPGIYVRRIPTER